MSALRSLVAYALGLMAINLFHTTMSPWLPSVYAPLASGAMRLAMLALVLAAGVVACFVVATVVVRAHWRNMLVFLAIMVTVDLDVVRGDWAAQPMWFKALIIALIPVQVWLGTRIAMVRARNATA